MTILVATDEGMVDIDAAEWVMYKPCGCAVAVFVAKYGEGDIPAVTEEMAWREFHWGERNKRRSIETKQRQGWTLRLMSHEKFRTEVDLGCTHKEEA